MPSDLVRGRLPVRAGAKPDNRHFRDYSLIGHAANMPKSTRMTHCRLIGCRLRTMQSRRSIGRSSFTPKGSAAHMPILAAASVFLTVRRSQHRRRQQHCRPQCAGGYDRARQNAGQDWSNGGRRRKTYVSQYGILFVGAGLRQRPPSRRRGSALQG